MNIKLMSLTVCNFKGLSNFNHVFDGKNAVISGRNGTGKTTVYDSFLWLLFGKNSMGESIFTITPTNEPEASVTVEAALDIDNEKKLIRKEYIPKYSKKTAEYAGHDLICSINGVPMKIREYERAISEIISEDTFRLLTSVSCFPDMDWKKRRDILFSLIDNISVDDIVSSDKKYNKISDFITACGSVENAAKSISDDIKKNSAELNSLPAMLSANRGDPVSYSEEDIKQEIDELHAELSEIAKNDHVEKINSEISALEAELETLKSRNEAYISEQKHGEENKNNEIHYAILTAESEVKSLQKSINENSNTISILIERREELRQDYKKILSESREVCPTCGAKFPPEKIKTIQADRKKETDKNIIQGKAYTKKIKDLESVIALDKEMLSKAVEKLNSLKQNKPIISVDYFDLPEFSEESERITNKINSLAEERAKAADEAENRNGKEIEVKSKLNAAYEKYSKLSESKTKAKIYTDLTRRQTELRQKQAENLKMLDMLDEISRKKAEMIEENVNKKFKRVHFSLFRKLKSVVDGYAECCEITANGAPNYTAINTAHKILSGIDIINVLSESYGIYVPLFIDNVDGLDDSNFDELMREVNTQTIALIVSNENLKVEEID